MSLIEFRHLSQHPVTPWVNAEVIGEQHTERLVSNERFASQNSVTETLHGALTNHRKHTSIDDITDTLEILFF